MKVDEDIATLVQEIKRLNTSKDITAVQVKFGILFKDELVQNRLEALLGTLKAAKKRKILNFDGELLLQGVHDNVMISLL